MFSDPTDTRLYLYRAKLLDQTEEATVRQRLDTDLVVQARYRSLPEPAMDSELPAHVGWRIPPPAFGAGMRVAAAPVLSGGRGRRGRFRIYVAGRADADQLDVVVLRGGAGAWEVMAPCRADERVTLASFPINRAGEYRLDLHRVGTDEARWAVVLVPSDTAVDWNLPAAERWAPLQRALAAGEVSAAAVVLPAA